MPTPAFTFPDSLTIYIHSKDLFVVLLNQFMPYARGPIDYGQTVSVSGQVFQEWWYITLRGYYTPELDKQLDHLMDSLRDSTHLRFIFILQEYSESS